MPFWFDLLPFCISFFLCLLPVWWRTEILQVKRLSSRKRWPSSCLWEMFSCISDDRFIPKMNKLPSFSPKSSSSSVRRGARYDKTRAKRWQSLRLDSLWQANSFNPRRDSNPSPSDKSVNKAIKAERQPLPSATRRKKKERNSINLIPHKLDWP